MTATDQHRDSVISRAFAVLATFTAEDASLSLTTIAQRAGLPLTTAHRLVKELCSWGALDRVEGGTYEIGLRLWMTGSLATRRQRFVERARPQMQDLYEAVHQTVLLAVRHDNNAVCIERVAGVRTLPAAGVLGVPQPLHTTAGGKILAAFGATELLSELLSGPLSRATPYSITHPERFMVEMESVRHRGFAIAVEENELGRAAIGVPVFGLPGQLAALGVAVNAQQAGDLVRFAQPLTRTAAALSRRLGHTDSRHN